MGPEMMRREAGNPETGNQEAESAKAMGARGAARREAILDAASLVFMEKGFARASLSEILARSGGSRATLYALFGSKEGLFEAVMGERCAEILSPLAPDATQGHTVEAVLTALAQRFLEVVLAEGPLATYRTVIAEARAFPKIAEIYFRMGYDGSIHRLAEYLERESRAGHLGIEDGVGAARIFLSMIRADILDRALAGATGRFDQADLARHIALCVRVFLAGVERPDDGKRPDGAGGA